MEKEKNVKETIHYNCQIGFCYRLLEKYENALKYYLKAQELGKNDEKLNK